MSSFQHRLSAIVAGNDDDDDESIALACIKQVSVLDKTLNVSALYPAFQRVTAISVDDPCATEKPTAKKLATLLSRRGFHSMELRSSILDMETISQSIDVGAVNSDGSVEVFFSSLTGIALVFKSKVRGI